MQKFGTSSKKLDEFPRLHDHVGDTYRSVDRGGPVTIILFVLAFPKLLLALSFTV